MSVLTTYLLLDGAQIDDLLPCLYSMQNDPLVYQLYQQTAYAEWADIGPCLVRVTRGEALVEHFKTRWRGHAGLLLHSHAETDVLAEHLRSLVHIHVDGGQTLLFRYYDPRILRLWLETLSPQELDLYLGPVQSVDLVAVDGRNQLIQRSNQPFQARTYTDEPWLHLSAEQLDVLNAAKHRVFEDRLLAHLHNHFPEQLALLDDAQRRHLVHHCRDSAARYHFSSADEVARWSNLLMVCGGDFPQGLQHARFRELLSQPGRSPAERLDDLLLAAVQPDKESTE